MLTDPRAIEIISKARQASVAQPARTEDDFNNIFADFFTPAHFARQRILELGPGQYDFARRARDCGATVDIVDSDPAVLELGRYLDFTTIEADLMTWNPVERSGQYDALFCKFSISALWLESPTAVAARIRGYDAVIKPGGWGWIAPWNGGTIQENPELFPRLVDAQIAAFTAAGWFAIDVPRALTIRYAITGTVVNNVLFLKNLAIPPALSNASRSVVLPGAREPID
jgi:hypothetical protein